MTGDELKTLQNDYMEISKEILLKDGHLHPLAFVIAKQEDAEGILENGFKMEALDLKDAFKKCDPEGHTILIMNMSMDYKNLFDATCHVFPNVAETIKGMLEVGKNVWHLPEPDVYMHIMRPFMQVSNIIDKDLTAALVRFVCEKAKAFAVIHTSEAWMASFDKDVPRSSLPDSIADIPESIEVIVSSLDTREFRRMLTVPIKRELPSDIKKRDSGKISGFGEIVESIDDLSGENHLGGRFVNFLKPLEKGTH